MQISEVEVVGKEEQMTAKDALLLWAKKVTQGYVTVTAHFLLYQFGESIHADLGKGPGGPRPYYLLNQNLGPLGRGAEIFPFTKRSKSSVQEHVPHVQ